MVEAPRGCRLYLVLPERLPVVVERALAQALGEADIACVLLTGQAESALPGLDARLREITFERDIALLVENDIDRAKRIDADGVHISPDAVLYAKARAELGERAIVGIGCLDNRHDAMTMAELGADYVAFRTADTDTIAWWSEIFVVPCLAWGVETADEAERSADAGADFVALAPSLLEAEGAASRIASIDAALRRARSAA